MLLQLALLIPFQGVQDLQPATYASPSGEWELFVDPTARNGAGPGRYRMTRAGEPVWQAELEPTLRQAFVNDRGVAAGWGLSEGDNRYEPEGDLVIAILSPAGELAFVERHPRERGFDSHSVLPLSPEGRELWALAGNAFTLHRLALPTRAGD